MKLTKEERDQKRKEKTDAYYSLRNNLEDVKYELNRIREGRGHGRVFKLLNTAIDLMIDQISDDHSRFVKQLGRLERKDEVQFMQKALNREKEKNAVLEKKIEEAKTSSGLFIDMVRKKLGI